MSNISRKFKCQKNKPHRWTWQQTREGKKVRAICDYIFSGETAEWRNFVPIDINFDTDHRLLTAKIISKGKEKYKHYVKMRMKPSVTLFSPRSKVSNSQNDQNEYLRIIKESIEEDQKGREKKKSWVSEETYGVLNRKIKALRQNDLEKIKQLGKELRRSLRKDRRNRVNEVSTKIEEELKRNNVVEAYNILRSWYKKFSGRSERPSLEDLASKREFYANLFSKEETERETLKINYEGNDVDDSIPEEKEIIKALFKLKNRRAPGLTGITVEQLKGWYRLAHPEDEKMLDEKAERNWNLIIKIIQKCFEEGKFPDAFKYGVLVLIPKDDMGGVRGIGLLETLHKLMSSIINIRLTKSIQFCEEIHGFRRGRGCYTAIGEAKLKIQETTCNYKTLYQIYLDLTKAYDSVDREQVMKILEEYRVGPRIR